MNSLRASMKLELISISTLVFLALSASASIIEVGSDRKKAEAVTPQIFSKPTMKYEFDLGDGFENGCSGQDAAAIADKILRRINQLRRGGSFCGRVYFKPTGPLRWSDMLLNAARRHSVDMAQTNVVDHVSFDGRTMADRVEATGYLFGVVGENVASGQIDVDQVMKDWQESSGHCENMMDERFEEVAAACVFKKNSYYKYYWTMQLGAPKSQVTREMSNSKERSTEIFHPRALSNGKQ